MTGPTPLPPGYVDLATDSDLADRVGVVAWAVLLRLARLMAEAGHLPGGWWIRGTQRQVVDGIMSAKRRPGDLGRGSISTALEHLEVAGLVRRELPRPRGRGMGSDAGGYWASWSPGFALPPDLRPRESTFSTLVDPTDVVGTPQQVQGHLRGSGFGGAFSWPTNVGIPESPSAFPSTAGSSWNHPAPGMGLQESMNPIPLMHGSHSFHVGAPESRDSQSPLMRRLRSELDRIDWHGPPPAGDPTVILTLIEALDADPAVGSTGAVLRIADRGRGVEWEAARRNLIQLPGRATPTPAPFRETVAALEAQVARDGDTCGHELPWDACPTCLEAGAQLRARLRGGGDG
jgi:hypothetical protein